MKKNIFSIIITALTVVNVVLTAILFFVMMPAFQKTNKLVTQVASILDLEIEPDDEEAEEDYTVSDIEYTDVAFEAQQTVNLGASASDKKDHYALFDGFTVGVNKKSDDYGDFKTETIASYQSTITDIIRSVMQSKTNDTISEELIKKESLEQIREKFGTKCVVELTLKNFMHQ
ncbi:MAG: hypothetical protein K1W24_11400 [Lachnospiraceae bacterium]